MLVPAYEKAVENAGGWESLCRVLYDCPPLPVVPQPQALLLEGPVVATAVAVADA